tara:strand:- start:113 stop:280 length:168 start_codon:yes stop_codon:yes gene_type:complete
MFPSKMAFSDACVAFKKILLGEIQIKPRGASSYEEINLIEIKNKLLIQKVVSLMQ